MKIVKCNKMLPAGGCDKEFHAKSIEEAFYNMLTHARVEHKELMNAWNEDMDKNSKWLEDIKKAGVWEEAEEIDQ